MNTKTVHNENGNIKLRLAKKRQNFKIFWALDKFKKHNVAFLKMKEMLIERQNMSKSTHKQKFVQTPSPVQNKKPKTKYKNNPHQRKRFN